jgi:hypothetical protein
MREEEAAFGPEKRETPQMSNGRYEFYLHTDEPDYDPDFDLPVRASQETVDALKLIPGQRISHDEFIAVLDREASLWLEFGQLSRHRSDVEPSDFADDS